MSTLKEVKLKDICTFKYGKIHPKSLKVDVGYPVYSGYRVTGYTSQYLYENPMLVVVARGVGGTGDVKISPKESWITNLSIVLDVDENKVDKYFLCDLLGLLSLKEKLDSGSAQSQITIDSLAPFKVNIPPLPIQKKIAKILSNYDDLIKNNLKRIKFLEESARLTYEDWFLRFRIDGEKLDIDSEMGLPYGWENKKIGDICDVSSSKRIFSSDYVDDGVPFYRGKEITIKSQNKSIANEYFISEEKFEEIDNRFGSPKINDILISAVGTLGSIYIVKESDGKFYFKDGNLLWLKNFIQDNSLFLFYALKSEKLQANISGIAIGSSQKALTIQALRSVEITCPDSSINQKFNEKIRPIVLLIENLINQNQFLKEARDILLPRLMTGMIDVEDMKVAV